MAARRKNSPSGVAVIGAILVVIVMAILKYWYIAAALLAVVIVAYAVNASRQKKAREEYLSLPVLYIGNKQTRTYHLPSCRTLANLDRSHTVAFRTREEPAQAGYRPCGTCKPD